MFSHVVFSKGLHGRKIKYGTTHIWIDDTLNRTFISKLVAIKIWQEWKRWAFMPPSLHVWDMFIKPGELKELLQKNGSDWKEHVGSSPNVSIPKMLGYLRKRVKGKWTYADLALYSSLSILL